MPIRIILADDHSIVREGLKSILRGEPEIVIVGEADNGREAVELACTHKPDVVIMDIGLPDLNGIEATRQVLAAVPGTKVMALSMHSDRHFVRQMFGAGAAGYLLKNFAFHELITAIRTVLKGETFISSKIAGVVLEDYRAAMRAGKDVAGSPLTPREREVLQLVAEGTTTKEIARKLKTRPKTIETHRLHIMEKLDLHTVAELVKYAVHEGITPSEM